METRRYSPEMSNNFPYGPEGMITPEISADKGLTRLGESRKNFTEIIDAMESK
jgi:hypothetical protein